MGGRLFLGNQMVSPVIIQGEEKVFNVDGYDWIGEINAQGELVAPTKNINLIFNGVKKINSTVLREKFKNDSRIKSVNFPDLESVTGENALVETFSGCPITEASFEKLKTISARNAFDRTFMSCPITSIIFNDLETISGSSACISAFRGTLVETITFPKLKTVSGSQSMASMFQSCPNLKRAYFPALETISSYLQINPAFASCPLLEYVDLSSLSVIGDSGLCKFFMNCPNLKSVDLSNLTEVQEGGLSNTFQNTGIETLSFPELVKINSDTSLLCMCVDCEYLSSISFPKLTTIENTSGYTDCFEDMLDGCSGVTVHFPAALEAVIGNWADVLAGFGGTNTTVLFDL